MRHDPRQGSEAHRNWRLGAPQHPAGCLCMVCQTTDHEEICQCWMCLSYALFFLPQPDPPASWVPSERAAKHIAKLRERGLRQTQIADLAGVSQGTVSRASHPGRKLTEAINEAILGVRPPRRRVRS